VKSLEREGAKVTDWRPDCAQVESLMDHLEAEMDCVSVLMDVHYDNLDCILAEEDGRPTPMSIIVAVTSNGVTAEASLEVGVAICLSPQAVAACLLGAGRARCQDRLRHTQRGA